LDECFAKFPNVMKNKVKIYVIVLINHGKQLKTLCSERTEKGIYKKFRELIKESNKVSFPMEYNNHYHHMIKAEYEIVIIKCKQDGDSSINKIRDEYGRFVNYESSDDDWIIVDRASFNVEETFWVYGYHPKLQRKTFDWVFDNMIAKDHKNKYMFKTVQLYKNKILIDCNGELNMVICKNKDDARRFYNLCEKRCVEKKMKYVAFLGDAFENINTRNQTVEKIQKLTNWTLSKIKRDNTRP